MDNKETNLEVTTTNEINNENVNVENNVETSNTNIVASEVSTNETPSEENSNVQPVETSENVTPVEETKTNEVRIINNEIELIIDEPGKDEVQEEEKVEEKVEKKRLLPFISNDDLFMIIVALVLVIAGMNLSKIYEFISKKKFKLDPSPIVTPNENNGNTNGENDNENVVDATKEYTLNCSKKNSDENYVFDYVYTINYKGTAYKMVYEIRSIDLSKIEDENEYNEKLSILNDFSNNSFQYTENALGLNGSEIVINDDGTFTQTLDLNVAQKKDINKVKEVMFYEVNDPIDMIKTKFENKGYTCK